MNNFYFSPSTSSFYPEELMDSYKESGTLPDDLIPVSDDIFLIYSGVPPVGKMRGANSERQPVWVDTPAQPREQQIALAESQKQALIAEANQKTQMWQTQLMLDIITEEDKANLKEWMLYVQQVQAVDPSLGAGVVWPTPPASPAR